MIALFNKLALVISIAALAGCSLSPDALLDQAKKAAGEGNHIKAIAIAQDISSDSTAYVSVEKLLPEWKKQAAGSLVIELFGVASGLDGLNSQRQAKLARLQVNAHSAQTMIETYGVDHGGTYPASVAELEQAAIADSYYKPFVNPFNSSSPRLVDFSNPAAGAVGYELTSDNRVSYRLHIWDEKGKPVYGDDGKPFILTSAE